MYQSGFGASASLNKEGAVYPGASRASKMTMHGPTRHQVLIPLDTPTAEVVVANAATAVESCNRAWLRLTLSLELSQYARHGMEYSCLLTLLHQQHSWR